MSNFKCFLSQGSNSCGVVIKKMQSGFVDFPNFAQGIGFANSKAISEAKEFSNVGFCQNCNTGVVYIDV